MPESTCNVCGRPLTDDISVALGVGPICRVKRKTMEFSSRQTNMFSNRANYTYEFDSEKKFIAIEDKGGAKSVTNDMENVLNDIFRSPDFQGKTKEEIESHKVMYLDSFLIWDGVRFEVEDGIITKMTVYSINEKDFNKAINKLLAL